MARRRPLTITRRNGRRQQSLKTTTLREFGGGWNVIDNDLNLDSRFSRILTNMTLLQDGSLGVRQGTRLVTDLRIHDAAEAMLLVDAEDEQIVTADGERLVTAFVRDLYDGTLSADPFIFINTSPVVRVLHQNHGMITGHVVRFNGYTTAHGVDASDINGIDFVVTYVSGDLYDITVANPATSSGTGGGSSVEYINRNDRITNDIINATYYDDRIIAVTNMGEVVEIDGQGQSRVIFNTQIASTQPDAPDGWGSTSFVSFAVFNGELIICNGIDKPLIVNFVNPEFPCLYLVDLSSSSNANTPICRYVVAMAEYLVMAGDITEPGTVYVSNRNTSGTWFNDAAPNDAVNVDVGKVVQSQNNVIRGIARFRETLIVAFDDAISFGVLGIYVDDVHVPDFSDSVFQYGTVSHRSMINLGNDLLMCDPIGVPSVSRSQFVGDLRPNRVSQLIDPEIQRAILALTVGATNDRVFAVFDQQDSRYMLFIPNASDIATTSETPCYVFTNQPSTKTNHWTKYKGWNWSCGLRSALGRLFFFEGTRLFVVGSNEDPIYADFIDDVFHDDVEDPAEGKNIPFVWELPWGDFNKRAIIKHLRTLAFDTDGYALFTVKLFIDRLYSYMSEQSYSIDDDDPDALYYIDDYETLLLGIGENTLDPVIDFTLRGAGGFGYNNTSPLSTADERSRGINTTFKLLKLRIEGETNQPLSFIGITMGYIEGNVQR